MWRALAEQFNKFSLHGPDRPELPQDQSLGSKMVSIGIALRHCMCQTDWSTMRGRGYSNPGSDNEFWVRTEYACSYVNDRAERNYRAKVGDGTYKMICISDIIALMTLDFSEQPWAYSRVRIEHLLMVYPKNKTSIGDETYEKLRSFGARTDSCLCWK